MAKIIAGGECIMHDVRENVIVAYRAMVAAGDNNVIYRED